MANIGLNPNFGEKNVLSFAKQIFFKCPKFPCMLGYTNFDSFGPAMLCSFRLMVQDYWDNLYHIVSEILKIYIIFL
jgi:hypothetical protein